MADGGGEHALASAGWFAPVLAFSSAAITAFVLWAGQRLIGKAAWQTAITAANKDLIDQLQEERRELRAEFEAYRSDRNAEKLAWAAERAQRDGEMINLTQALESLKALLRRRGIDVPEHYHSGVDLIVIEGEKK